MSRLPQLHDPGGSQPPGPSLLCRASVGEMLWTAPRGPEDRNRGGSSWRGGGRQRKTDHSRTGHGAAHRCPGGALLPVPPPKGRVPLRRCCLMKKPLVLKGGPHTVLSVTNGQQLRKTVPRRDQRTPTGRERETGLSGKAREDPPDAQTLVLRLPTPLGRGGVQQTELPPGLQNTPRLFKCVWREPGENPPSCRGWRVICRALGGHLSLPGSLCPGGGPHGSRVQGRRTSQGDLILFPGGPRGAPCSAQPVCGPVPSQGELPSAIGAPGPARPGPAGLPVTRQRLPTCRGHTPLL